MELNENLERLKKKGLGVAAISYDSPSILKSFAERKGIRFPLLSDADSTAIRAFGILNEQVPKTSAFFGIPSPVTFLVRPDGTVESRFEEEDYRKRFTTGAILAEPLATGPGVQVKNSKLELKASATDATVRGGERVRLFLNVKLAKKMHVYAPGVQGYIPVEWKMTAGPSDTSAAPQFPASKQLRLKAINEVVPAYLGEFAVTRDIVIPQPRDVEKLLSPAGEFTVEGTFRYQACDDKKCYIPEEIPLKWTFKYEKHDSTRVPADLQRKAPVPAAPRP